MERLVDKDKQYIWHPFTQMLTEQFPIVISHGKGAKLYSEDGKEYIDGISSWWVNLHGHCHPDIASAISSQVQKLDQVIFAGFTHEPAIEFSRELLEVLNNSDNPESKDKLQFGKIFFSDNGSTAVEVALKMAVQYWSNQGIKKNKILALQNSYHGDTFGSMSVSDRGAFTLPFHEMLFEVIYLPSPAENPEITILELEKICLNHKNDIAAFIYEPMVQGAGGMLMYGPHVLEEMLKHCKSNDILTIADEVMTGFGRTGKIFASHYAKYLPDIICISKGITGGVLPLAVTACTNHIYNAFLSSDRLKTFFHGHSYTGNSLSIAAARASLELLQKNLDKLDFIHSEHLNFLDKLRGFSNVRNPRLRGTILAFEIVTMEGSTYFNKQRDFIYQSFMEDGVLLRPLGNTIYILPPYCIEMKELQNIYTAIENLLLKLK